jgi:beta-galactosidase
MKFYKTEVFRACLVLLFCPAFGVQPWASAQSSDPSRPRQAAPSGIQFRWEFAPSEGLVKPPERPVRDDLCLNGLWQFQPLALPPTFREGVDPAPDLPSAEPGKWESTPIKIPSPWNVNNFADRNGKGGDFRAFPSYPASWETVKMGWLRRTFTVPDGWKGRRILLHFAAVAGDVQVRVNGVQAGRRFDIFFPFEFDVTDLVRPGASNEVLVGVRKASLFESRGRYGRRNYQGGSFWGQHIAGIWQDVDLVAVPAVHVTDVFVQPQVDKHLLKAEVTLRNDTSEAVTVTVSGDVRPWVSLAEKQGFGKANPKWKLGDPVELRLVDSAVPLPANSQRTVSIEQTVGANFPQWSPDSPHLHALLINVNSGGSLLDRKYTRFGWRQVTLRGSQVLLNGHRLVLSGDAWHFLGIPQMTRRYAWAWFNAARAAHLNAVRLHAQPYPEFYLDVADEMGMLILDETAIWASDGGPKLDSDAFWHDTEGHVTELVLRDRNHPSVFGWSVCNEVRPVIRNVFHGPPEMAATLKRYYQIWADICRRLDPTRQWISADGDDDGDGALPIYLTHYPGDGAMAVAAKSGKPWGVGEAGEAYYATPQQTAATYGERAYESFLGRMEGIAISSYEHLLTQKRLDASYRSVFNVVWYALQPLPLGLADTSRPPTIDDGVFFPEFVEGKPGVQPERLGPYCTTLNPGYDPALPPYRTWPLFDAIGDATANPTVSFSFPPPPNAADVPSASPAPVKSVVVLAGDGSKLSERLSGMGVDVSRPTNTGSSGIVFIDGQYPPGAEARKAIDSTIHPRGTVIVWGARNETLPALNLLLPAPLELTGRKASSLALGAKSPITAGLRPSEMYFSELLPPTMLDGGLGGPLVAKSAILLQASNVDWMMWNRQPEYAKTGMVFRSEMEAKPSGAALIEFKNGSGRLLVSNLTIDSGVTKEQLLIRRILANIGVPVPVSVSPDEAMLADGKLVHALAAGRFPAGGGEAGSADPVDPGEGAKFRESAPAHNLRWIRLSADAGTFDLESPALTGSRENSRVYLSFWVFSPRSLDDLLIEPNIPKVDFKLQTRGGAELFVNGKSVATKNAGPGDLEAHSLQFRKGWNHLLIEVAPGREGRSLSAEIVCADREFLRSLKSAPQTP